MGNPADLLTQTEVLDLLRRVGLPSSRQTLWRWRQDGTVKARKIGGVLRFERRAIEDLLQGEAA